jgi:hypothetical protein
MAEWTGPRRTLNSIPAEYDPTPVDAASELPQSPPQAPGAIDSPQLPGATPDNPDLPGRPRGSQRSLTSNRRPLTEYGTAQRFLRLFTPAPGTELEPADWEQGPSSQEEQRKADPALLTPPRPLGGYGLGLGRSAPAIPPAVTQAVALTEETTPSIPIAEHGLLTETPQPASSDLAVEETTMDVPAGAIRGTGAVACPPEYPVKGNAQSKIYHTQASRVYEQTIAEYCFATVEAAEAAGYRAPKNL